MSPDKNTNEEYKGPGKMAAAIGQSSVDGMTGTVVGAVTGAVAGMFMHNKDKHQSAVDFLSDRNADLRSGVSPNVVMADISQRGALKTAWQSMGKGGKAITAAVGLAVAGGLLASVIGLFRGSNKAESAQAQFQEMHNSQKALLTKVEHLEEELTQAKSFVKTLGEERHHTNTKAEIRGK